MRREKYIEIGQDRDGGIFFDRNGNFERNGDLSTINRDGDKERSKEKGDRRGD